MKYMVPTIIIFTAKRIIWKNLLNLQFTKWKQPKKNMVQIPIVQLTLQEILREILYARMDVNFFLNEPSM